jgi:hypothetical protein
MPATCPHGCGGPVISGISASNDRMDYTIIGAEANLAARLQSIGEPGKIVLSYETYALVSDMVRARAMDPISMKGISREVVPYVIDEVAGEFANRPKVISERERSELVSRSRGPRSRRGAKYQESLAGCLERLGRHPRSNRVLNPIRSPSDI